MRRSAVVTIKCHYKSTLTARQKTQGRQRNSRYTVKIILKVVLIAVGHSPLSYNKALALCPFDCQVLGKLYAVLSDQEQRRLYDEQGAVDEGDDLLTHDRCWEEYWRLLFPKVRFSCSSMTLCE